jgi:hypothetical protein
MKPWLSPVAWRPQPAKQLLLLLYNKMIKITLKKQAIRKKSLPHGKIKISHGIFHKLIHRHGG